MKLKIQQKKIGLFSLVIISQVLLVYLFIYNENFIDSFKYSYLREIYIPSYGLQISNYINNSKKSNDEFGKKIYLSNAENTQYADSIPVLLYHGVVDSWDDSNVMLADFRKQMFALKNDGWSAVSLDDFEKFIKGQIQLPQKSFLLTFDDGRKDSYYPVDIILKSLNFRATIFIITDHSINNYKDFFYLSKDELMRMKNSGRWDIEAHTRAGHDFYLVDANGKQGHFYSNKLWIKEENRLETEEEFKKRILGDFGGAKNDLEQNLGITVSAFAFPFGDFGQNSITFTDLGYLESMVLKKVSSIYAVYFYQISPGIQSLFNYPKINNGLVGRINVRPDWTPEYLLVLLNSGLEKKLPFHDNFDDIKGWIKNWGNLTYGQNYMVLASSAGSQSASILLDGSNLWSNYTFSPQIDSFQADTIMLNARFKDKDNYVSCQYAHKDVFVVQNLKGRNNILAQNSNFEMPKNNFALGISVVGNGVRCYVNNILVVSTDNLDPQLNSGSIGFQISDSEIGKANIIIKDVYVNPGKNDAEIIKPPLYISGIKNETPGLSTQAIEKIKFGGFAWDRWYGSVSSTKEGMLMDANASSTGAGLLLHGSKLNQNYLFTANVEWLRGVSVQVLARRVDENNFIYCNFVHNTSSDYVAVFKVDSGVKVRLEEMNLYNASSRTTTTMKVGIRVNGDKISCVLNSTELQFNTQIPENLWFGGVGIQIWDPKINNSQMLIRNIEHIKI